MKDDLIFRGIVIGLFVGARYVRWHARHDIGWQVSWPAMKKHPRDTALLLALSAFWLSAVVIYVATPELVTSFRLPIPIWMRWCGVGLAGSGLALLYWSDRTLGKNLSVSLRIREGHTLVTHGPYSRIRHPIYTATLVYSAAMAVITANWLLGAMFVVPMVTLIAQRLGPEERMMLEQFDDEYRDYTRRTGRLLPRLW